MLGAEFRKWAEHGCRAYGDDPWFFLRELAQNSRDAGAHHVRVAAFRNEAGLETVVFEDDGRGMTLDHARRYLFCLYASSKEKEKRSAGRYGIGFWSVLRYEPSLIVVESAPFPGGRGGWRIELDKSFAPRLLDCRLEQRGTRISLVRRSHFQTEQELLQQVEDALTRYCQFLRRNDRRGSKLPVIFRGRNLTRSMRLEGPLSLSFRDGPVEGAVGLGAVPSVSLYARGLPVWKGTTLEELSHLSTNLPQTTGEVAPGLMPVFLLNGNNLNVVMDRKGAIDDPALAALQKSARRALSRLVHLHVENTFPRSLPRRILDFLGRGKEAVLSVSPAASILFVLAICVLVWAAGFVLRKGAQHQKGASSSHVSLAPTAYRGAIVEGTRTASLIEMSYTPPLPAWFKILTADTYDTARGFLPDGGEEGKQEALLLPPKVKCHRGCIEVDLRVRRGGWTYLPMPSGCILDPESLKLDTRPRPSAARLTKSGDAMVNLPPGGGFLEYSCSPPPTPGNRVTTIAIDPLLLKRLTHLPPALAIPSDVDSLLQSLASSSASAEAKVVASAAIVRSLLVYDSSPLAADLYKGGVRKTSGWLDLVLRTGRGDCDVFNGLAVLFLRRMGVPARLAVGLTGRGGRIEGEVHAWTEYFDASSGWRTVDISPPVPVTTTAGTAAGLPPRPAPASSSSLVPPAVEDLPLGGELSRWRKAAELPQPPPLPSSLPELPRSVKSYHPSGPSAPAILRSLHTDRSTSTHHEKRSAISRTLLLVLILLGGLPVVASLVLAFFLILRGRRWEEIKTVKNRKLAEEIVAQMMASAATNPRQWGHMRELWTSRVLPTLSGDRISVLKAHKLSKKGKLFMGTCRCPLAIEAARAGSVVLDSGDKAFGSLIARICSARDLDSVWRLGPVVSSDNGGDRKGGDGCASAAQSGCGNEWSGSEAKWSEEGSHALGFIKRIDELLNRSGEREVRCVLCPGLTWEEFRDVDLSGLSLPRSFEYFPRRFIAVSPNGTFVRRCIEMSVERPLLAACIFIDAISQKSLLLSGRGEKIRFKTSSVLIKEAASY